MSEYPKVYVPKGVRGLTMMMCGCIDEAATWKVVMDELLRATNHDGQGDLTGYQYFVACVLDDCDLTEHGTSIRYSWLTDEGKAVLAFLQEHGLNWQEKPIEFAFKDEDGHDLTLNDPWGRHG